MADAAAGVLLAACAAAGACAVAGASGAAPVGAPAAQAGACNALHLPWFFTSKERADAARSAASAHTAKPVNVTKAAAQKKAYGADTPMWHVHATEKPELAMAEQHRYEHALRAAWDELDEARHDPAAMAATPSGRLHELMRTAASLGPKLHAAPPLSVDAALAGLVAFVDYTQLHMELSLLDKLLAVRSAALAESALGVEVQVEAVLRDVCVRVEEDAATRDREAVALQWDAFATGVQQVELPDRAGTRRWTLHIFRAAGELSVRCSLLDATGVPARVICFRRAPAALPPGELAVEVMLSIHGGARWPAWRLMPSPTAQAGSDVILRAAGSLACTGVRVTDIRTDRAAHGFGAVVRIASNDTDFSRGVPGYDQALPPHPVGVFLRAASGRGKKAAVDSPGAAGSHTPAPRRPEGLRVSFGPVDLMTPCAGERGARIP
jgi:hypothetical protein